MDHVRALNRRSSKHQSSTKGRGNPRRAAWKGHRRESSRAPRGGAPNKVTGQSWKDKQADKWNMGCSLERFNRKMHYLFVILMSIISLAMILEPFLVLEWCDSTLILFVRMAMQWCSTCPKPYSDVWFLFWKRLGKLQPTFADPMTPFTMTSLDVWFGSFDSQRQKQTCCGPNQMDKWIMVLLCVCVSNLIDCLFIHRLPSYSQTNQEIPPKQTNN